MTTPPTPPRSSPTSACRPPTSPATPAVPPSPLSWPWNTPRVVHTLALLELSLALGAQRRGLPRPGRTGVRGVRQRGPRGALALFMSVASGLDWVACRALLEEQVPGSVAQAVKDADTFFGVELPALGEWAFGAEQAAAIRHPVLSVLGGRTQPLWVEVAAFLRASVPGRRGVHDRRRRPPPAHRAGQPRRRSDRSVPRRATPSPPSDATRSSVRGPRWARLCHR